MRGRPPELALVYLPNGLSPGAGTLKDELMGLAGWRNLAAERGITGYGSLGLEDLVSHAPRAVLFDAVDLQLASLAQALLRHPALGGHIRALSHPDGELDLRRPADRRGGRKARRVALRNGVRVEFPKEIRLCPHFLPREI